MNNGPATMSCFASGQMTPPSGESATWAALGTADDASSGLEANGEDDPLFLQIRLAELSGALAMMDRSLREARRCGIPVSDRHTRLAADIWAAQRLLRRIASQLSLPRA